MKYSAWVVVEYDGTYLILQRGKKANNPNKWNLPGGGLEKKSGEKPKDTAARELWEEAHIKIKKKDLTFLKRITAGDRQMLYYHIKFDKKPKVKIDFESQGFKWCKPEEFPSKLHFQTKIFHKHLGKMELGSASGDWKTVVKKVLSLAA